MKIASLAKRSFLLTVIASASLADPLPKSATPLSADQIAKLYSGNSAVWETSMVYFAPDGTTKGVFGKPPKAVYSGTWSISKNKICMTNVPTNIKSKKTDTRTYTDCWIYYADGKAILNSYYNDFEKGKGPNKDYSEGELAHLKPGDVVSKKYMKYGGA